MVTPKTTTKVTTHSVYRSTGYGSIQVRATREMSGKTVTKETFEESVTVDLADIHYVPVADVISNLTAASAGLTEAMVTAEVDGYDSYDTSVVYKVSGWKPATAAHIKDFLKAEADEEKRADAAKAREAKRKATEKKRADAVAARKKAAEEKKVADRVAVEIAKLKAEGKITDVKL